MALLNEALNVVAFDISKFFRISSCTFGVAVAVRPIIGTSPKKIIFKGDGETLVTGRDEYTVVRPDSDKTFTLEIYNNDGITDTQSISISPAPKILEFSVTKNKNGND